MSEAKKITVGMFRPLYAEVVKNLSGQWCPLCERRILGSAGIDSSQLAHCWSQGHFDTPVYQEVAPAFPENILNGAKALKYVFDQGVCYEDRSEATDQFLYELVSWIVSEDKKRASATPTDRDLSGESKDDVWCGKCRVYHKDGRCPVCDDPTRK